MKKIKRFFTILLVILLIAAGAYIAWTVAYNRNAKPTTTISSDLISSSVKEISELSTKEYYYTNVGSFENTLDFYGWQLPLTTKQFIVSYKGKIKLGIDAQKVESEVVDKNITIYLPDVKILSHEIDESSIEVLNQSTSIFNPAKVDDYSGFTRDQKIEVEEELKQQDIYTQAEQSAQKQIEQFVKIILTATESEDYTISFKNISEYKGAVNFSSEEISPSK